MGVQMSLLVALGEFLPKWVRAIGLRAEGIDKLVFSFGPDSLETDTADEEKIELVLSRVACDRDLVVNALVSTGNDADAAISLLRSFSYVVRQHSNWQI